MAAPSISSMMIVGVPLTNRQVIISATTSPKGLPLSWDGDVGDDLIISPDGERITTSYATSGRKTIIAHLGRNEAKMTFDIAVDPFPPSPNIVIPPTIGVPERYPDTTYISTHGDADFRRFAHKFHHAWGIKCKRVDSLADIIRDIAERPPQEVVRIVAHGTPGEIRLRLKKGERSWFTVDDIANLAADPPWPILVQARQRLRDSHIDIRGCNIGLTPLFLNAFAQLFAAGGTSPKLSAPKLFVEFGEPNWKAIWNDRVEEFDRIAELAKEDVDYWADVTGIAQQSGTWARDNAADRLSLIAFTIGVLPSYNPPTAHAKVRQTFYVTQDMRPTVPSGTPREAPVHLWLTSQWTAGVATSAALQAAIVSLKWLWVKRRRAPPYTGQMGFLGRFLIVPDPEYHNNILHVG